MIKDDALLIKSVKFDRDYHCGLIGYIPKKKPQPMTDSSLPKQAHGLFQPHVLGRDSSGFIGAKVSPSGVYELEMNAFENHVTKKFRTSKPPHLNSQGKCSADSLVEHRLNSQCQYIKRLSDINI